MQPIGIPRLRRTDTRLMGESPLGSCDGDCSKGDFLFSCGTGLPAGLLTDRDACPTAFRRSCCLVDRNE
jgi:hypothetical protein